MCGCIGTRVLTLNLDAIITKHIALLELRVMLMAVIIL